MKGKYFANLITKQFPNLFVVVGKSHSDNKMFVMDNDPSQNPAFAKKNMEEFGFILQKTPMQSPDLNPIENLFHVVRKRIRQAAIKKNIIKESWPRFVTRVELCIQLLYYIDKTIASVPKRLQLICCTSKGRRIKY